MATRTDAANAAATLPADESLRAATLDGLLGQPKRISCAWLYDDRGSRLFDRICELPEYYVCRTEVAILREHLREVARAVGPRASVIEPGSGSSYKTELLIDALEHPAGYAPVDISALHLRGAVRRLRIRYPDLRICPIHGDFTQRFAVPASAAAAPRLVFFPGSTIGNFNPAEARRLLRNWRRLAPGGFLLIGIDLVKDPGILLPAYDDAAGVTAAFNLNALTHLNRSLGWDFDTSAFRHRAVWNAAHSRIEMHLVSVRAQEIHVGGGASVHLDAGEPVVSEHSYKYTLAGFEAIARGAGWRTRSVWLDAKRWFSVQLLAADDTAGIAGSHANVA